MKLSNPSGIQRIFFQTKNRFDVVDEILPVDVGVQNDPEANEADPGEPSTTDGGVINQSQLILEHDCENIQSARLHIEYLEQHHKEMIGYAREATEAAAAASKHTLVTMNQIIQKVEKEQKSNRSVFASLKIPFSFLEYGISAFEMMIILVIGVSLTWIITQIHPFQRI